MTKEGYNEIGDREVDLDTYSQAVVETVQAGASLISKAALYDGIGVVSFQQQDKYGLWDTIEEYIIEDGKIIK